MSWIRSHKTLVANLGLILLLIIGGIYLLIAIVRVNPLKDTYEVRVNLDRSGGLQTNSDVTYRGYRVGHVKSIEITDTGIAAVTEIDSSAEIPMGGQVTVQALSAAGEQYIDFQPDSDGAPYLEDGAVIEYNPDNIKTPPPLSQVLNNATTLINQINPDKFQTIVEQLDIALSGGSVPLATVMAGTSETAAGLDSILPQTTGLIANLRTIMATTSLAQPDLGTLTANSGELFTQLSLATAELNNFLDSAPGQLSSLGGSINAITEPATTLAQNFAVILQAGSLRTPALAALFPALRDGGEALQIPVWGGGLATMADIWVRPYCDYTTVPRDPTVVAADQTVPLYQSYCPNHDPSILIRGSANAPRPQDPDNTAFPPAGVNLDERSTPEPPR